MAEPSYGCSDDIWVDAHTAVLDRIFAGTTNPTPKMQICDSTDQVLAQVELDSVASSVSAVGLLSLVIVDQPDPLENIAGVASYAQVLDRDETIHLRYPCAQGETPVAGYCVLNDLTIAQNRPVYIVSLNIPPGPSLS